MRTAMLLVIPMLIAISLASYPVSAQDDPQATISALETEVAELEAQIADMIGVESTPVPSPNVPPVLAEAIPLTDDFVLLDYYFVESDGDLYAFGEIQNIGVASALAPIVTFTFFDEDGASYGVEELTSEAYWIPAGGRASIQTTNVLGGALLPGDWASVEVGSDVNSFVDLAEVSLDGVEIRDAQVEGAVGELARGVLANESSQPVGPISIKVSYYDENGRFIGSCSGDYLDVTIPPGRAVRFSVDTSGSCGFVRVSTSLEGNGDPKTYRLVFTGLRF